MPLHIKLILCRYISGCINSLRCSAVKSVAVSDAATQSSVSPAHVHGAPCHNLLEEVRRDNQEL